MNKAKLFFVAIAGIMVIFVVVVGFVCMEENANSFSGTITPDQSMFCGFSNMIYDPETIPDSSFIIFNENKFLDNDEFLYVIFDSQSDFPGKELLTQRNTSEDLKDKTLKIKGRKINSFGSVVKRGVIEEVSLSEN